MQQVHGAGLRFEIVRPLGRGGYGAVSEAIDVRSGQRVALKELTRFGASALLRFKQEFRIIADLHHPNLARLRELFEQDGRWYIAMELVEGLDLLSFVRAAPTQVPALAEGRGPVALDEARLRKAFAGVAEGLVALHRRGILHRDLKPSNVKITPEGRAVLLDFGLATELGAQGAAVSQGGIGSLLYVAPEQAAGELTTQAADWYAFGACLYEALCGQPPFNAGSRYKIMLDKLREEPPHAASLAPAAIPADVTALCMRLLSREPGARPGGEEVLRVLGQPQPAELASGTRRLNRLSPSGRAFAGRERELAQLALLFAAAQQDGPRVVLIEGESGVGKSELIAEFAARELASRSNAAVLRGRCYENEHVSYKAFDGCIDELTAVLRRTASEAQTLVPPDAELLAQLFPVLGVVLAETGGRAKAFSSDPAARRLKALGALAGLLGNVAQQRPLMLLIDDLQWADAESFRMLRGLVEDDHAPPLLLLASVRPRAELEAPVRDALDMIRSWPCTTVIPLAELSRSESEGLAEMLLGDASDPLLASVIARESRGHPLFLMELVQFTRTQDLTSDCALNLESAIKARIAELPDQARRLLELIALCARPHVAPVFARALGALNVDQEATLLLGAKLVRVRRDHELGCYHDRIRQAVVDLTDASQLPGCHQRLAEALSQEADRDAAELAVHWERAGYADRAIAAYEEAARQAFTSLAFDQAQSLYERALILLGDTRDAQHARLLTERADALACAGRSAQAAPLFRQAAQLVGGEQRLVLRGRAAEQLMQSTDIGSGLDEARGLLADLGIHLPRTPWAILGRALWNRSCTRAAGWLPDRLRSVEPQPGRLQVAQDLLRQFGIVHNELSLGLTTEYVRLAIHARDARHRLRAQAYEGWWRTVSGSIEDGAPFFEAARAAVRELGDPALIVHHLSLEGSASIAAWDWARGAALLAEAEVLLREQCPDDPWSRTLVRYHLGAAWYHLGETARLADSAELWLREARERQDHFAVALLAGMGMGAVRHLMRGDPDAALHELDAALSRIPAEPFSFPHFGHMLGVQLALTMKGGSAALDWLHANQRRLDRAFLLRTRMGRDSRQFFTFCAQLRAYDTMSSTQRRQVLKHARKVAAERICAQALYPRALGYLAAAQLDALEGEEERALQHARAAEQLYVQIRYLGATPATFLVGLLEGGQSGRERCEAVLRGWAAQGWSDPRRALCLALPALPHLEQRRG